LTLDGPLFFCPEKLRPSPKKAEGKSCTSPTNCPHVACHSNTLMGRGRQIESLQGPSLWALQG
jgi:hypothetical protein